jgi:hypothetical protein
MLDTMSQKKFHVAGPDIDLDLLRVLTCGDKVLAEINGVRPWSSFAVRDVADDAPWTVVENVPDQYITLSNPRVAHDLTLQYSSLITTADHQPAVFMEDQSPLNPKGTLYVILQLITGGATEEALLDENNPLGVEPFDKIATLEILDDPTTKMGLLEQWCRVIGTFSQTGWGYRSERRFAVRARIKIATVRAFKSRDWQTILELSDEQLIDVAKALHSLPYLVRLSRSYISHDYNTPV